LLAQELEQELDLDGLNLESDSAIAEIAGINELVDTSDSELLSLDDLEEDTAPVKDEELPDMDVVDEVNTKLDLARAYVEMEDHEGAKGILDEVLSEGNDGQKEEARRLLEELA